MIYKFRPNKEGKIPKQAVADMQKDFKFYALKMIEVIIRPYKKKFSNQQLRYYYAAIRTPFALHFGYDLDKAHEIIKYWVGWYDVVTLPNGETTKIIRSITKNEKGEKSTTTDLMFIINTAIRLCAEHGLQIESPEEYFENNHKEY